MDNCDYGVFGGYHRQVFHEISSLKHFVLWLSTSIRYVHVCHTNFIFVIVNFCMGTEKKTDK